MMDVQEATSSCYELIAADSLAPSVILCCKCGSPTEANEAHLCILCLEAEIEKEETISSTNTLYMCRTCQRFEGKPTWLRCGLESKELLALCLRKIKKDKECRIVSANFEWTEPHSKRVKVTVGIEKEYFGATVRREMLITFVVMNKQCAECAKSVTPHIWVANLQVRQRASYKRNILFLEQLILKYSAHSSCIDIVDLPDGLDFHFAKPQHAATLAQFIRNSICSKIQPVATQLVSHDSKSNNYSNKYTQLVDLCPLNRDDLVFLPKKVAGALGGVPQILLCARVSTGVQFIDPFTLRGIDLDTEKYWRSEIFPVMSKEHLKDFIVLDVNLLNVEDCNTSANASRFLSGMPSQSVDGKGKKSQQGHQRFALAEVEIARMSDFGVNDTRLYIRSHLGNFLKPGDIVCGYDLVTSNIKDTHCELEPYLTKVNFDVILVKKKQKMSNFNWVLRTLPKTTESGGNLSAQGRVKAQDFMDFKTELHTDPLARSAVMVYANPKTQDKMADDDEEFGCLDVIELMQGLTIDDNII